MAETPRKAFELDRPKAPSDDSSRRGPIDSSTAVAATKATLTSPGVPPAQVDPPMTKPGNVTRTITLDLGFKQVGCTVDRPKRAFDKASKASPKSSPAMTFITGGCADAKHFEEDVDMMQRRVDKIAPISQSGETSAQPTRK
ncbi:hypothetical protein SCP_0305780 [Sparassis crispa]|uniref:Uncharacterized protein n=1 Tax=Sparassis crispa TaxID=139825 RepID=A0A401GF94_9APHY|nr:hypothetical protein SCP_0305780 [Sparassis crispa]GBE80858.1 hypothetical protein SCP_0305780 [Sparassis crispa]